MVVRSFAFSDANSARDSILVCGEAEWFNSRKVAIGHQALLYPSVGAGDTESRRQNADAYILSGADMARFGELYAGPSDDWRVSPIKAPSLAGLPATLIEVGGQSTARRRGALRGGARESGRRGRADRVPGHAARLPQLSPIRARRDGRHHGGRRIPTPRPAVTPSYEPSQAKPSRAGGRLRPVVQPRTRR